MKPRTLRAGEAGLTLLEILVVLTIATLLISAVPWGRFSVLETVELKAVSRELAATLRRAREEAVRTHTAQRVLIDVAGRRFGRDGGAEPIAIPEDVEIRFRAAREDLTGPGTGAVVFMPDGSANGGSIRLARGRRTARIEVAWVTGRVSLHDS
ncbi:MAG: GspH/FimT family pseudopilin [Alphaproteobacteria bacterium]